jgi:hypothetical protein
MSKMDPTTCLSFPFSAGTKRMSKDDPCLFCGGRGIDVPSKFVRGEIVQFFDTDLGEYIIGVISKRVRNMEALLQPGRDH